MVALGSLHWYFETIQSNKSDHQDGFALQQYVKAIAYVLVPIREKGKQAADVALMSCVLFTCFEVVILSFTLVITTCDLTTFPDPSRTL